MSLLVMTFGSAPVDGAVWGTPLSMTFKTVFLASQLVAGLGMFTTMFIALFARQVRRPSTWYNFCFGWIVSAVVYTLFLIYDENWWSKTPSPTLCVVQASTIYALVVFCALTNMAYVLEIWITTRLMEMPAIGTYYGPTTLLLVAPYVLSTATLVEAFAYAIAHPGSTVLMQGLYCANIHRFPTAVSAVVVCVATTLTFVFQLLIGVPLWRRRFQKQSAAMKASTPLFIRFAIFSIFDLIGAVASVMFALQQFGAASNSLIAIMPVGAWLVFGTQGDLLQALSCGRRRNPSRPSTPLLDK
ncbi:hypothetical protein PUNSTDRAFT_138980 [Punctularia strigosozonata HHB-11173 SS5]|uniref:Uncharacterized protein n=1 Tax=Punctularia strigosozonata (strain HHB-11173) TaxID=741275 RepID=R7S3X6_PUNST|nr:uncharacterized protein PUNSTDRAFT_138980 [Punctularia strigosozonata HHB-11173 SS5]EIN03936.1 hypothetical protein PUNSTDRAFT_138980 [Punctularia strigosozonata HHB-11173 SS5]